jgi:hypothetical protein
MSMLVPRKIPSPTSAATLRSAVALLTAALLLALLPGTGAGAAVDDSVALYKIQAGYLYQLTKFVSWPESAFSSATSPFRICVTPQADIRPFLEPLQSRNTAGRAIAVAELVTSDAIGQCQVLVISGHDHDRLSEWLKILGTAPVLTVSALDGFAERMGMIGFVVSGGKLKLDINLDNLQRNHLVASAKLLEVARRIHGGGSDP